MDITNKERRLNRFYGDVARLQNRAIIDLITGSKILDIGCGYGTLIKQIMDEKHGAEVVGIDIDPESISKAKELYGLNIKPISVYNMSFTDGSFETIILREAIHHFDEPGSLDRALSEIRRVCSKELIVFDPNPNWIVKLSRRLIKHKDPEAPLETVLQALRSKGFAVKTCKLRDVIAFPLSGGFVGRELVPNVKFMKDIIVTLDGAINVLLRMLRIEKFFCWRYVIYAVKVGK